MLEGRNLWELVEARAEATPDAVMTIDESGQSVTFGAYRASAEAVAAGLVAEGVGEGDVVSWVLPTWHGSLVLIAALCRIGAVQNPITPIHRDREVGSVTRQAQATLLVVPGEWRGFDFTAMAERIAGENPHPPKVLETSAALPDGDPSTLPPPPEPPATRADEPATWLFFTSGTTAEPKGARHSDGDLIVTARGMGDRMRCREGDRNLMAFPVTHITGPVWLASSLMYGLTNVITEAFDPRATPELGSKADVTLAGSATFFHMAYLAAQRAAPEGVRIFPRLRLCPGGGAPKPPALHEEVRAELGGLGIVSGWGLTEAPMLTMGSALDPDDKLATTEGRALPGVLLRTVSLDGVVTGPGEEGELRAKAPQMMRGYLDGSLDADAFDEDGWFRTGDLGVVDEDGFVRITGRVRDVIIGTGENVSAAEVEDLLHRHPKVTDVAVIGIPDAARGEMVCAVVAGTEGDEPLTVDEMVAHLTAAGLGTHAVPERLEVVDAIPRNASGEIAKHELRRTFGA
jgi:acyl-CoA synthetase (AMP-forming)/AMP-acid ligase II